MSLMMSMRLMVRAPVMLVAALFFSIRISYRTSATRLAQAAVRVSIMKIMETIMRDIMIC